MKWLQTEIATGFQKLVTLRLKNTPSEEVLVATVGVWLDTLINANIAWDEQLDRARVAEAFKLLCRTCDSWPSIKSFLDVLPARPPPPMLPAPKYDRAKALQNLAKLKATLKKPIFKRI